MELSLASKLIRLISIYEDEGEWGREYIAKLMTAQSFEMGRKLWDKAETLNKLVHEAHATSSELPETFGPEYEGDVFKKPLTERGRAWIQDRANRFGPLKPIF